MCALCGVLGIEHWADAHDRPGAFTRNTGPRERWRERARRVGCAGAILRHAGLALADWNGAAFLLTTHTGKTEIVDNLGHLWIAAEALLGHPLDPLAPDLLDRLEGQS